ncbi:MAG TPA: hypothetical protein PK629_06025 [Oscillospiraceae bacterium]|nr:hypothetical protein [Oscillospiraceae bacterium]HPF56813.1 hypothetical protein [Clostridiales bacterium]HPK34579.1 hypothetical protein [Oscillospiraceae bacterium]HPR75957.1 hypothetical protein [Oscillospiraceae bacterium]
MRKFSAFVLLAISVGMIVACANPTNSSNKTGLYDYQALYTYHSDTPTIETLESVGQYLQAKDILDLISVQFAQEPDDAHDDSVIFNYALQLTPGNPEYTIDHQAIMQDVILIFVLFPNINTVEIDFTQADYSFGCRYTKEEATEVFGQDIAIFGESEKNFTELFPPLLESVDYHPDVMDTVNYYHAMGLDEPG